MNDDNTIKCALYNVYNVKWKSKKEGSAILFCEGIAFIIGDSGNAMLRCEI